jgi:upstream activation factor subunit UAF30
MALTALERGNGSSFTPLAWPAMLSAMANLLRWLGTKRSPPLPLAAENKGNEDAMATKPTTDGAAKKAPAAKPAAKKVNPALMKPMTPSHELAAIVGKDPLPRPHVVSKVWDYIKKHNLQNPTNKREILADKKLQAVFEKDRASMFEMNKHLSRHLK